MAWEMVTRAADIEALGLAVPAEAPPVPLARAVRLELSLSPEEVAALVCRHPGACLEIGDEDGEQMAFELTSRVRFVIWDLCARGFKARCPARASDVESPILVVALDRRPWGCTLQARFEKYRELNRGTVVALCAFLAFSAVSLAAMSLFLPLVVLCMIGALVIDLAVNRPRRQSLSMFGHRLQGLLGELFARFTLPERDSRDAPYRDRTPWTSCG